MRLSSRLIILVYVVLLVSGCTGGMIKISETEQPHPIPDGISEEKLKASILEGAKNADWVAEDQGFISILATYQIRIHTVRVGIYYSDKSYRTLFESSDTMKVYCTERDRRNRKHVLSGKAICPSNLVPLYINKNYKVWVDRLVASIDRSLAVK